MPVFENSIGSAVEPAAPWTAPRDTDSSAATQFEVFGAVSSMDGVDSVAAASALLGAASDVSGWVVVADVDGSSTGGGAADCCPAHPAITAPVAKSNTGQNFLVVLIVSKATDF